MRESIMYVKDDESIGAERGIQCMRSSSTARVRCGRALSSIKMKSGPMAPRNRDAQGEEVPPHNSDPRLQTLYRKCGAQFARSA
ncbi:hypothetical protein TNCV_2355701 [Trichonephila clavipes]|nr:hypothetical protein TNCV_2355701 [Trichonephila clavipes]